MSDLDDLEAKARAATPAPWRVGEHGSLVPADGRKGYIAAARVGPFGEQYIHAEQHDLAYLAAASPDVILALVARVRRAEAALAEVRTTLDYDLRDQPDKVCDRRIWTANMNAHKIARMALEGDHE